MNSNYRGLHILSTIKVADKKWLVECDKWIQFITKVVEQNGLNQVGMTHYEFPNHSYTAAICLKESHICIHTWPEFDKIYLDIYVCNLLEDNTQKAMNVYEEIKQSFDATVISESQIQR